MSIKNHLTGVQKKMADAFPRCKFFTATKIAKSSSPPRIPCKPIMIWVLLRISIGPKGSDDAQITMRFLTNFANVIYYKACRKIRQMKEVRLKFM